SKLLVGWRRESQGGLVAVLCSCLLPSSYALEVYVAWGFWRDLFDGTQRPFPKQGLPLLVRLTGAVITSPQPVLLVRRITPFGYYVLRGIKGLSRLKGKLLVGGSSAGRCMCL
ncbi:hypothetical protein HaLaN_02351, partial [Haematococcus lacustris]